MRHVDIKTLVQLKLVNRAWLERARRALRRRSRQVWPASLAASAYWTAFTAEQSRKFGMTTSQGREAMAKDTDTMFHRGWIHSQGP